MSLLRASNEKAEKNPVHEQLQRIPIAAIFVEGNIRTEFHDETIQEISLSIQTSGLLSPIRVEAVDDRFRLIHGERRLRGCQLAGWTEIPAIVVNRHSDDRTRLREMLVENCQRENLKPVDTARALLALRDEVGGTAAQVAREVGFSESKVSRLLSMLQWPTELQERVNTGKLKLTAAAELARLNEAERQESMARVESGELTRDALAGSRKRRDRQPATSESRSERVRAVLRPDRSVTITAPDLDLENMILILQELLEKARKVRSQGLELNTFLKVLKDTSRTVTGRGV